MTKKKSYQKPKMSKKKIVVSLFFSTRNSFNDFSFIEHVYASSGCACGECGNSTSDCGACDCTN